MSQTNCVARLTSEWCCESVSQVMGKEDGVRVGWGSVREGGGGEGGGGGGEGERGGGGGRRGGRTGGGEGEGQEEKRGEEEKHVKHSICMSNSTPPYRGGG